MEREPISGENQARQRQILRSYAAKHGMNIFEIGYGLVCRGRNNSHQSCYARALCDTSHDNNARRHGCPSNAVYVLYVGNNGKVLSKPAYAGVEIRRKSS